LKKALKLELLKIFFNNLCSCVVPYRQAAHSPENAMLWRPTVKFLAGPYRRLCTEDTGENKKSGEQARTIKCIENARVNAF